MKKKNVDSVQNLNFETVKENMQISNENHLGFVIDDDPLL